VNLEMCALKQMHPIPTWMQFIRHFTAAGFVLKMHFLKAGFKAQPPPG
jgi:hypothetical protein